MFFYLFIYFNQTKALVLWFVSDFYFPIFPKCQTKHLQRPPSFSKKTININSYHGSIIRKDQVFTFYWKI